MIRFVASQFSFTGTTNEGCSFTAFGCGGASSSVEFQEDKLGQKDETRKMPSTQITLESQAGDPEPQTGTVLGGSGADSEKPE